MKLLSLCKIDKLAKLAILLSLPASLFAAPTRVSDWCEQGGQRVLVPGSLPSIRFWQQSYPGCTITIYNAGTLTLSTIFSDANSTPMANPFTANINNGYFFFFANPGNYGARFSGSTIPVPFNGYYTIGVGGGGGGLCPSDPNQSVQFNSAGACGGDSNFIWDSTDGLTLGKNLNFTGSTSGTAIITAQAVQANPTLLLPTGSGTFGVTATGPIVLDAVTGDISCPTCSTGSTQVHMIEFEIDGQGSAITTGDLGKFPSANFTCTIDKAMISADASGSITVDVWKVNAAIPTGSNKISASSPITLSSTQLNQNSSLSGWSGLAVVPNDVFGFTVASVATVTKVTGQIFCQ